MVKEIIQNTSWQEWLGVLFSVIQVLLARKNNPSNYLFGILGVILTLYVMFFSKLYAEFTLNLYYLVMSIYGWVYWKMGKQNALVKISQCNKLDWIKVAGIVLLSFVLFVWALTKYTNSDVPIWDAAVSAFAWAGMWLMAKRKIENWIILNVSNLISIPLMMHKDLHLYALLSIFLFILAIFGFYTWRKIMRDELKLPQKAS